MRCKQAMAAPVETPSVEVLQVTLNKVRSLRSGVTNFFRVLAEGPKEENEDEEKVESSLGESCIKTLADIKNQLRFVLEGFVLLNAGF